jgi:hypothetical protein
LEEKVGEDCLKMLRPHMSDEAIQIWLSSVGRDKLLAISRAKFVVLAGDCVDGAGGQATLEWLGNVAGLTAPRSPYIGELQSFRSFLLDCPKPIFAVPGNHDAGAGYGGILNWPADGISALLNRCGWLGGAASVRDINNWVPGLVRTHLFGAIPLRYDGLVEWQYLAGPLNQTFVYRGNQFLLLNTFHLDRWHRASAGGVALNTGGGIQPEDVAWVTNALSWFGLLNPTTRNVASNSQQFLFMHHDPRAGQPLETGTEHRFGIYETIDTPVAIATFGYGGLFSYSTRNGLFLPLVSAPLEYGYRHMYGVEGGLAREWMRRGTFWDSDAYCARPLAEAISAHLTEATNTNRRAGISEMFFAHNNLPAEARWLRDPASRLLFRTPGDAPWAGKEYSFWERLIFPFVTKDAKEPPGWARKMRVPANRNARVVRLDDVSDTFFDKYHGFVVVDVHTEGPNKLHHISLPETKRKLF